MLNFNFSKQCYSCGACVYICPKSAIQWSDNLTPSVNNKLCVNCGKCDDVCPKINRKQVSISSFKEGFVCKNTDDEIRLHSSSGGVFYSLATNFINNRGYVCGCVFDEMFMPKHIVTNDISDVRKMMGSKYVMSDIQGCYSEIEGVLKNGNHIMFVGLPCQTVAIYNVFKKYEEQILLVALVCHGSIARDFWKKYLDENADAEKQLTFVTMRDKGLGWGNYGLKFEYDDGTSTCAYRNKDGYFLKCFTSGYFQRHRCLTCEYKGNAICADILLGDGWGMEKRVPDIVDDLGVSAVLTLSEKGTNVINSLSDYVYINSIEKDYICSSNPRINTPAPKIDGLYRFQKKCINKKHRILDVCRKYSRKKHYIVKLKQITFRLWKR